MVLEAAMSQFWELTREAEVQGVGVRGFAVEAAGSLQIQTTLNRKP